MDSILVHSGIMKTTVDVPDDELADAMWVAKASSKREAIVMTIREFNRRRRLSALTRHAGTCRDLMPFAANQVTGTLA